MSEKEIDEMERNGTENNTENGESIEVEPLSDQEMDSVSGGLSAICSVSFCS